MSIQCSVQRSCASLIIFCTEFLAKTSSLVALLCCWLEIRLKFLRCLAKHCGIPVPKLSMTSLAKCFARDFSRRLSSCWLDVAHVATDQGCGTVAGAPTREEFLAILDRLRDGESQKRIGLRQQRVLSFC